MPDFTKSPRERALEALNTAHFHLADGSRDEAHVQATSAVAEALLQVAQEIRDK